MVLLFGELTRSVIGAFLKVYNTLGYGLLENPYIGALVVELERRGHKVQREVPIAVEYEGIVVGSYRVDLLVDDRLIIEVKAEPTLTGLHQRQLLNYLQCSRIEIGLILVFGIKPMYKRLIHTSDVKKKTG